MGSVGSNGSTDASLPEGLTNPTTKTFPITAGFVEFSRTFPDDTKYFRIHNDGPYVLKVAYQQDESDINYVPVYPGDDMKVYGIVAASVTLYMQSPVPITLHIESWT